MGRRHLAQGGAVARQQSRIALADDIERRYLQAGQSDCNGVGPSVEEDQRPWAERVGPVRERGAGRHGPVHADQRDRPPARRRLCHHPGQHAAQAQPVLQPALCRATRRIVTWGLQADGQYTQAVGLQHVGHETVTGMLAAGLVRVCDQHQRMGAVLLG